MKKYYTTVAMNGEMIDEFNTEEEARAAIELYEEEDRINGIAVRAFRLKTVKGW